MAINTENPNSYKTTYPDSVKPDADVAVKFLTDFADGGPITVVMIPDEGHGGRGQTFNTSDLDAVIDMRSFISAHESRHSQVFYMPNRAADDCGHAIPAREDIVEIRAVVLDFDPSKTTPLEEERLRLREVLDNLIDTDLCTPTTAVDTGGGMQVIYRLKTPLRLPPPDGFDKAVEQYETLVKALARSFGADTKTWRINNLFRCPGTYNWPNASKKAAGRERTVSGVWHHGGPQTSLEALKRLCVIRPEDLATPAKEFDIDFEGLTEPELIDVLGRPQRLPERIQTLLRSTPALEMAVKRPVTNPTPGDTSKDDHILCMSLARMRVPPGDMALILAAFGAKVKRTHQEKRLFSYVARTVSKAIHKVAVEMGFESPADAEAAQQAHFKRMQARSLKEMLDNLFAEQENGVIEGLIGGHGTTVVYGQSGSGKTFVMLDMAYRVSLGLPWCGRRTTQGVVIYVAAESPYSVRRRLKALVDLHGYSDDFLTLPEVVNMFDKRVDFAKLLEELDKVGKPIRAIIFDTLARVMLGGNENSTEHMSTLVANGDELRDRYKTNVIWVHHSGKDESLGARGSSALRAATDTEIEIKEGRKFNVTKLRDADQFSAKFELKPVEIGAMPDGTVVSTCVVDWGGIDAPTANDPGARLRDQIRAVLELFGAPATIKEIMRDGKAHDLIKHGVAIESLRNAIIRAIAKDSYFKEFESTEKGEKRYGLLNW